MHSPLGCRVLVLFALGLTAIACGDGDGGGDRARVESALGAFAADLAADPPAEAELAARIRAYLQANPEFFGSTVALIGNDGLVFYSPYVYRLDGGLAQKDLAFPEYEIDSQEWLAAPRDRMEAIWTDPYFDAGGGEIWMVTRSVPLLRDGVVYAVVTTDLPVDPPRD
jgi:sigma-B regulation protein RsbU (phosphoserine phosphatase)